MGLWVFPVALMIAVSCGGETFDGSPLGSVCDGCVDAGEGAATTAGSVGGGGTDVGGGGSSAMAGGGSSGGSGGGSGGDAGAGGRCQSTTCAALGKNCGKIDDGCGAQLDCGECLPNAPCDQNVCGSCTPTSCAQEQWYCGTLDDGCNNMLGCGGSYTPGLCDFGQPYGCACPFDYAENILCDNTPPNGDLGNTPPPNGTCIENPVNTPQGSYGWCCKVGL